MVTRFLRWSAISALVVVFGIPLGMAQRDIATAAAVNVPPTVIERYHPAVGSWIGIAVQICQAGVAPSACSVAGPATTLFMTPTLTSDGIFIGNDSLALQGVPFGPHTTAHGKWIPTSQTDFIADYVFMLNTYPPVQDTITGIRFRWLASVSSTDTNTMTGYVNAYFVPGVPIGWSQLSTGSFPTFPSQGLPLVTSPGVFFKNPSDCNLGAGCPLIFAFTIKRVTP